MEKEIDKGVCLTLHDSLGRSYSGPSIRQSQQITPPEGKAISIRIRGVLRNLSELVFSDNDSQD